MENWLITKISFIDFQWSTIYDSVESSFILKIQDKCDVQSEII